MTPEHSDRHSLTLEPDEPLPPDLPPDGQRYQLVVENVRGNPLIVAGLIVVSGVAGVVLAAVGAWGGFVAASLVAIALAAWARKGARLRFVPSETGDYVLVQRSASEEAPGSPAAPPAMSTRSRVACGALGVVLLAVVVLATMEGALPSAAGQAVFLGAGLGMGLIYAAVKGEPPFSQAPDMPTSPRFRSLADPTRPLPDDAPISGPREREAGRADRNALPYPEANGSIQQERPEGW